jgi:hypothetical protein
LIWRMARYILPTRGRLERKCVKLNPLCPLCYLEKESHEHLFMHCQVTKMLGLASN